jgi:hypothetical protein
VTVISYYSTNRQAPEVDLARALLQGQAGDRGLYLPRPLPRFGPDLLAGPATSATRSWRPRILGLFAEGVFSRDDLEEICADAYDFAVPLERSTGPGTCCAWTRGRPPRSRTSPRASWAGRSAAWFASAAASCWS